MNQSLFFCVFCLLLVLSVQGQTTTEKVNYMPKLDGAVKAKMELSTFDGSYRFNVRNTRFGLAGNASAHMFYRVQVDFSNEGKLGVLDAFAGYRWNGFEVKLGQQQIRFSSDLDRGPNTNMFANRSFLAKYLTSYVGQDLVDGKAVGFVRTLGSRDLGATVNYRFKEVPVVVYAGVFNGAGVNNPEWSSTANVMGRVEWGLAERGLRGALSYYHGRTPTHNEIFTQDGGAKVQRAVTNPLQMVGGELRYIRGGLFIEGEYARRYVEQQDGVQSVLIASHIHSYYRFAMRPQSQLTYIAPIVRWDLGDNVDYFNTVTKTAQAFHANRITMGVNFGFGEKFVRSEIRLNYEKYILKSRPSDYATNRLLQDKFTLEVVATF